MLQKLDFNGQTALIMGASQGIGLATAQTLAQYDATVILVARSSEKIEMEAESIRSQGLKAFAVTCDVSDYESVATAVKLNLWQRWLKVIRKFGRDRLISITKAFTTVCGRRYRSCSNKGAARSLT